MVRWLACFGIACGEPVLVEDVLVRGTVAWPGLNRGPFWSVKGLLVTAALIVLAVVVVVVLVVSVLIYNGLVRRRNQVDSAWSQMDVQRRRRYDLIPNLVETVKGYASHEQGTLDAVTEARARALNAQDPADQASAEIMLTGALKSLFVVAESYPDLRASQKLPGAAAGAVGHRGPRRLCAPELQRRRADLQQCRHHGAAAYLRGHLQVPDPRVLPGERGGAGLGPGPVLGCWREPEATHATDLGHDPGFLPGCVSGLGAAGVILLEA